MAIKAIITGATGMVGEGVLHECLKHPDVESVLVINRKPCGVEHPKLKEIIHHDFFDFSAIEDQLNGYDAAYFCLGVSSMGMKEEAYHKIAYDLTMAFAKMVKQKNPAIAFTYVSGVGTDASEKGRSMWARVKGKTENDLLAFFDQAYMFRPGYIQPTRGLKNSYKIYKILAPFYPIWIALFPGHVCTLEDLGLAMIHSTKMKPDMKHLEIKDINALAFQEKQQLALIKG